MQRQQSVKPAVCWPALAPIRHGVPALVLLALAISAKLQACFTDTVCTEGGSGKLLSAARLPPAVAPLCMGQLPRPHHAQCEG